MLVGEEEEEEEEEEDEGPWNVHQRTRDAFKMKKAESIRLSEKIFKILHTEGIEKRNEAFSVLFFTVCDKVESV